MKATGRPDIDRVLTLAARLRTAIQTALKEEPPPGTTIDDILSAYTYTLGELILMGRQGNVEEALDDAAIITDSLVKVIRDVLRPTTIRETH